MIRECVLGLFNQVRMWPGGPSSKADWKDPSCTALAIWRLVHESSYVCRAELFFGGLLVVQDARNDCFDRTGHYVSRDMVYTRMPR